MIWCFWCVYRYDSLRLNFFCIWKGAGIFSMLMSARQIIKTNISWRFSETQLLKKYIVLSSFKAHLHANKLLLKMSWRKLSRNNNFSNCRYTLIQWSVDEWFYGLKKEIEMHEYIFYWKSNQSWTLAKPNRQENDVSERQRRKKLELGKTLMFYLLMLDSDEAG